MLWVLRARRGLLAKREPLGLAELGLQERLERRAKLGQQARQGRSARRERRGRQARRVKLAQLALPGIRVRLAT